MAKADPAMLTTAQIAEALGVTPHRVLRIARSRGVEPALRVGVAWLWRAEDLGELRPGPHGVRRDQRLPRQSG